MRDTAMSDSYDIFINCNSLDTTVTAKFVHDKYISKDYILPVPQLVKARIYVDKEI